MVSLKQYFLLSAFVMVLTSCATGIAMQPEKNNIQSSETIHQQKADQSTDSPQYKFPSKSEIPDFLKNKSTICKSCFLGVSDPGIDSALAVKQALDRAAVMEALTDKTEIKFITDFYTKVIHDKQWEVFAHLFEITLKVKKMKPDTISFSKYDEAIVLAKPEGNLLSDKKRMVLSGFIQEKTYGNLADYMYRFEMKSPAGNTFVIRIVNDNFSVESLHGDKPKADYPKKNFIYNSNIATDSTWKTPGFSLRTGLWPSFFGGLLKNMFYQVKETAEYEVGNMRDTYSEDLNVRLKRQTGSNTFSVDVQGCEIYNNHLTPLVHSTIKK